MATVALVNPQLISSSWRRGLQPKNMDDALPRHSLTFLSASLKQAGHDVTLIDLRLLSGWNQYETLVHQYQPDFLCVTAHTSESDLAIECCARGKRLATATRTVAGGIHFTMYPEAAISSGVVDYVVRGEAEVSLPQLVSDPGSFEPIFWGELRDLDDIPFEDRELYPDYAQRTLFPLWDLPTPVVDLLTKRGCPWQCRFCCGPGEQNLYTRASTISDHRYPTFRHRSVPNVIAEMEELEREYRFRGAVFHDDQFIIRRDWVAEFCRALHDAGFVGRGLRWWAAVRADVICREPELIARMRDAGQQVMSIGFESFSDRMLRWMKKDTTSAINFQAAEICHRNGLDIFANVILGMPYEDGRWYLEDDSVSLDAIRQIRPRYFSPSHFSPIPGSWFYQWAVDHDLLIAEGSQHSGSRTPDEAKLKGVDYGTIDALLAEYRSEADHTLAEKKPLRLKLKHFAKRPIRSQISLIRSKLLG